MYRVNTGSGTRTRLTLATLVLSSTALTPVGLAAQELPAGGVVGAGDAAILETANGLAIRQTSQNAIINWSDFSIGAGGSVVFNNGSGATLNRVTGTGISKIDGSLSATGSLYLVNRNGIVIGKDGVITTGGSFVASTLDIKDKDFLDGGDMTFSGENAATIINKGKIGSLGGDVALISRHIRNEGTLEAPEGTVGLAAGREVLLRDAALDDGKFLVRVGDADSSITEAGMINAAHAELRAHGGNIYALAGNKGGAINANRDSQGRRADIPHRRRRQGPDQQAGPRDPRQGARRPPGRRRKKQHRHQCRYCFGRRLAPCRQHWRNWRQDRDRWP